MTERSPQQIADPVTWPYWAAAEDRVLLIQTCQTCGARQHYPRGFCLSCQGLDLGWVEAGGGGTVYSLVTVRVAVIPDLEPPYQVALVDLDEGVRMLTNIVGEAAGIGDRVTLDWRERIGAPPVPVFRRL